MGKHFVKPKEKATSAKISLIFRVKCRPQAIDVTAKTNILNVNILRLSKSLQPTKISKNLSLSENVRERERNSLVYWIFKSIDISYGWFFFSSSSGVFDIRLRFIWSTAKSFVLCDSVVTKLDLIILYIEANDFRNISYWLISSSVRRHSIGLASMPQCISTIPTDSYIFAMVCFFSAIHRTHTNVSIDSCMMNLNDRRRRRNFCYQTLLLRRHLLAECQVESLKTHFEGLSMKIPTTYSFKIKSKYIHHHKYKMKHLVKWLKYQLDSENL